jgi:hypothetical protein
MFKMVDNMLKGSMANRNKDTIDRYDISKSAL